MYTGTKGLAMWCGQGASGGGPLVLVRETNRDCRFSAVAEEMAEQRFSAAVKFQGLILFIEICNAYII
jgi:hypothetical protein